MTEITSGDRVRHVHSRATGTVIGVGGSVSRPFINVRWDDIAATCNYSPDELLLITQKYADRPE